VSTLAVPTLASDAPLTAPALAAGNRTLSYLAHFGLAEPPFGLTPDTDFFYASPPHREALDTLRYALANGDGFLRIVGAVGTGKTLLCRTLLAELPAHTRALYLPNPTLDPAGILFAVAAELGFKVTGKENAYQVQRAIHARLLLLARQGIQVVLVIDEAQALPTESLEAVRLLSNLETEKRKLLAIVLFGQPELDARLEAIPQLNTRISFHDALRPLTRDELAAYLDHRLARAGLAPGAGPLFTARAVGALHAASGGVPRVANVIAHKALLLAYGRGLKRVGRRVLRQAARDTLAARPLRNPWLRAAAALALVAAGAVAGWLAQTYLA
jgi:MSHA biogenesis protein MshM